MPRTNLQQLPHSNCSKIDTDFRSSSKILQVQVIELALGPGNVLKVSVFPILEPDSAAFDVFFHDAWAASVFDAVNKDDILHISGVQFQSATQNGSSRSFILTDEQGNNDAVLIVCPSDRCKPKKTITWKSITCRRDSFDEDSMVCCAEPSINLSKIGRISFPSQAVSFYGAISSYKSPRPSKGPDWIVSLALTDETCGSNWSFKVNVFGRKSNLPQIDRVGDIILCRNVVIQRWQNQPMGVMKSPSFLCYSGNIGATFKPYQYSGCSPIIGPQHKQTLENLRRWTAGQATSGQLVDDGQYVKRISELGQSPHCDLVCKVIAITTDRYFQELFLWDGTDISMPTLRPCYPNQLMVSDELCAPDYGSIIPMKISADSMNNIECCSWVKIRNITVSTFNGTVELRFSKKSSIQILPIDSKSITDILDEYEKRCGKERTSQAQISSQEHAIIPQPISVTPTHTDIPFTPIKSIVSIQEPHKLFRIRARVISYLPSKIEQFCVRICRRCEFVSADSDICQSCGILLTEHTYMFKLNLSDPTGCLSVIVFDKHASAFLLGLPPVNMMNNNASCDELKHRINKIMGNGILCACILSSPVRSHDNEVSVEFDNMRYHLVHTMLT